MEKQEPRWLHIGVDDEQAIELLERLANEEDLRARLEAEPRDVLLKEFRIDFPTAPESVSLPPPETIRRYVDELRKPEPFGRYFNLAHGIVLMWVAHGNGHPPPPPDPDGDGNPAEDEASAA
jgi:hypothetical protein